MTKTVHAARARVGPHGPNHGTLTAKPSSHHVHVTLWVALSTSPCPTLSADAEPARVARRDSFLRSAQYDVTKRQLGVYRVKLPGKPATATLIESFSFFEVHTQSQIIPSEVQKAIFNGLENAYCKLKYNNSKQVEGFCKCGSSTPHAATRYIEEEHCYLVCSETSNNGGKLCKEYEMWFKEQSSSSKTGICGSVTLFCITNRGVHVCTFLNQIVSTRKQPIRSHVKIAFTNAEAKDVTWE